MRASYSYRPTNASRSLENQNHCMVASRCRIAIISIFFYGGVHALLRSRSVIQYPFYSRSIKQTCGHQRASLFAMSKRSSSDISKKATDDKTSEIAESSVARKSSRATKAINYADEEESKSKKVKSEPTSSKSNVCGIPKKPEEADVLDQVMPKPKRNPKGELVFPDFPNFRPNLTPREVLQMGSFGGTYFRPITSSVTGKSYKDVWKELPEDWLEGLDVKTQVASPTYTKSLNKYKETCGGDLEMWESSGWITSIDPYGWFMWYCRFYQGRRSTDDDRQVGRGNGVIGASGRWRNNLANKVLASGLPLPAACEKYTISPKIRQLLQHWGYQLTIADLEAAAKKKK